MLGHSPLYKMLLGSWRCFDEWFLIVFSWTIVLKKIMCLRHCGEPRQTWYWGCGLIFHIPRRRCPRCAMWCARCGQRLPGDLVQGWILGPGGQCHHQRQHDQVTHYIYRPQLPICYHVRFTNVSRRNVGLYRCKVRTPQGTPYADYNLSWEGIA